MSQPENFLYSNLFIALVTIVVGLFAFVLYLMKKADTKKRIARIIMLEITNAESQLRDARNRLEESKKSGYKKLPEHLYVMPLDTWTVHRHLFVNDFKTNEWEALNEFYNKCQLFDAAIRHNDSRFSKDEQQLRESVHRATYDFAHEMFNKITSSTTEQERQKLEYDFFEKRDGMAKFITSGENVWIYTPSKELRDIEYIISSVDYNLSTSSVGVRLGRLAKKYQWFGFNKR